MTLLHYDLPGHGSVLGHEISEHLADIPEELVQDVLQNPLWRLATDDEKAAAVQAKVPRRKKAE